MLFVSIILLPLCKSWETFCNVQLGRFLFSAYANLESIFFLRYMKKAPEKETKQIHALANGYPLLSNKKIRDNKCMQVPPAFTYSWHSPLCRLKSFIWGS